MPKRISKKLKDSNQIAAAVVAASTSGIIAVDAKGNIYTQEETPQIARETLSRVMAEMGRRGGKIGGKRSLETMSAARRKKRAKDAAKARWNPVK
jgi:hypothetical protein